MRTLLLLAAVTLLIAACVSNDGVSDSVAPVVARECSAEPGSPLDVAGEPDWRQYAAYEPWTDTDGCMVRIDVLAERPGPDHCGWEESRVIIAGDPFGTRYSNSATHAEYVRDPNGVYGMADFVEGFAISETLPDDAVDTGYRQDGRELWLSPSDPDAIFMRAGDSVERWPRGEVPACS